MKPVVYIRMSEELKQRITERARIQRQTVNEFAIEAFTGWLAACEEQDKFEQEQRQENANADLRH